MSGVLSTRMGSLPYYSARGSWNRLLAIEKN
jgi:hypothetical protein